VFGRGAVAIGYSQVGLILPLSLLIFLCYITMMFLVD
jgi:hypothetical protein